MASLGDIDVILHKYSRTNIPVRAAQHPRRFSHGTTFRTLGGVVLGLPGDLSGIQVRACRRPSGDVAASCFPDSAGSFSMQVDGDPKTYFVVALSPDGSTYNAALNDRVASV